MGVNAAAKANGIRANGEPANLRQRKPISRLTLLLWGAAAVGLIVVLAIFGLLLGSTSPEQTWTALFGGSSGNELSDLLIRDYRLARVLLAIAAGAALAVAGVLVQALTRNPLTDPGLLGVNAGAYLAIIIALNLGVGALAIWLLPVSLLGAAVAAAAIYFIGGSTQGSAARLVLAGIALTSVLSGIGFALALTNRNTFNAIRFWNSGSIDGRALNVLWNTLPLIVVGLVIAALLTRPLNAIALGHEQARSLGTRVRRIEFLGFLAITLLCAASTTAIGPISFLGLMVPHVARIITGPDQRRIMLFSMLLGPILFLGADIVGRVINPSEVPVGVVVAFLGAPLLILLARKVKAL